MTTDTTSTARPTMTTYTLRDVESGVTRRIRTRRGLAGARAIARAWTLGAYDAPTELGATSCWVDVDIIQRGEIVQTVVIQIDPSEPRCEASAHDWQYRGVHGHGGGVICRDRCRTCGLVRITDTWSTRPDNGTQGWTTVRFEA